MGEKKYQWAAAGDINAFFGLMLDNIARLVLAVGMLSSIFSFPVEFALRYMVPGTAIGVLVGDLLFFGLAFFYAKKTGKTNVTAMPLGLDTPSTIGMVLFVLGPAFSSGIDAGLDETAAAMQAWKIGMCAIFISGLVKVVFAFGSNWLRTVFPRAGLLGSLAAIALVLIAFTKPFIELAKNPIVGFASLVIVFVTLIGRSKLPFKIPGALGAVGIGCIAWYLMLGIEQVSGASFMPVHAADSVTVWFPTEWMAAFSFDWFNYMDETVAYLPYVIPFAIATVIGGIDCAESAASVGDDFSTGSVIGIEAIATLAAACCGGVIQTTPYIGHPAYKAMGGRAAYTLATALFVGAAGLIGYFSLLFQLIPEAAVLPILIFIGLEITAQSFHATPRRHYAALAVACMPALAKLVTIFLGQFVGWINWDTVPPPVAENLKTLLLSLNVLAGGFIISSLIWASATAKIIDRRFFSASIYFALGGMLVLFGVMHSPLEGDKMFLPWELSNAEIFSAAAKNVVVQFAIAYLVMAVLLFALGSKTVEKVIDSDEEYDNLTT